MGTIFNPYLQLSFSRKKTDSELFLYKKKVVNKD
jgi:hypothetical protein